MCDIRVDSRSKFGRIREYDMSDLYTPSYLEEMIASCLLKEGTSSPSIVARMDMVSKSIHQNHNNNNHHNQREEEDCGYGYYYDTDPF